MVILVLEKLFFTHCIAKELLDLSYFVLYFTAFDFFDLLSRNTFQKDAESADMASFIYECDLLIIRRFRHRAHQ